MSRKLCFSFIIGYGLPKYAIRKKSATHYIRTLVRPIRKLVLKRCDRMSPSRFYAMLRKFLSDLNEICTIGAHYDGDHITKVVAQDDK